MASKEYFRNFRVCFEPIFDPETESQDVKGIEILIRARNVNEALKKAWDTVRVIPEHFEITLVGLDGGYVRTRGYVHNKEF